MVVLVYIVLTRQHLITSLLIHVYFLHRYKWPCLLVRRKEKPLSKVVAASLM